ncbi:MAG: peptidylprolyl isomerase [Candidatus Woesearchaeota archaeon]
MNHNNHKDVVKKGDLVKIDYSASLPDGVIFDTSIGFVADRCGILDDVREYKPMEFIVGSGSVIPGLEEAVLGMRINESKTVMISANEAFGEHDPEKIKRVPKELCGKQSIIKGEHLVITDGNKAVLCHVEEVTEDSVVLDLNHPLAGRDIILNIKVLAINGKPESNQNGNSQTL